MDTVTESTSTAMTEANWQVAHAIAQTLVKQETDVNELGKAIAYLRNAINQSQPDAGLRFFRYLKTLVNNGRSIGHSGRTLDYYRNIEKVCSDYLLSHQAQPATLLHILGWAARLMRYYREGGAIGEITPPTPTAVMSARQVEVERVKRSQEFQVDQVLEATVTKINGSKVTYEVLETIKLTQKEPKKAAFLQEGQAVQVKIVALKEDGSVKSIKCVS